MAKIQKSRKANKKSSILYMRLLNLGNDAKSAVVLHPRKVQVSPSRKTQQDKIIKLLTKEMEQHLPGSNRPITITEYNENNSPVTAKTPGGTEMKRSISLGVLSIFSSDQSLKISPAEKAILSSTKSALDTVLVYRKLQKLKVDKNSFKFGRKRKKSQQRVMLEAGVDRSLISAQEYAKAIKQLESTHLKWEWLHLIANMIYGDKGQIADNLVCGTANANTNMLMVETKLKYLVQGDSTGFTLSVQSDMVEDSHLATNIAYDIKFAGITISFQFDAQSDVQPTVIYNQYIDGFFKAVQNLHDIDNMKTPSPSPKRSEPPKITVHDIGTLTAKKLEL